MEKEWANWPFWRYGQDAQEWAVNLADDIEMRLPFGELAFPVTPGNHCGECPLADECPDAQTVPPDQISMASKSVRWIADKFGISSLAAYVLASRGYDISNAGAVVGKIPYSDPFALPFMTQAVGLVRSIARKGVVVAGDYDIDGISGSLIVSRTLDQLGIPNDIYLPDRSEG